MRFDKLRLVAWLFFAFGLFGAFMTVRSGWNGRLNLDVSIFGLWIAFDLLGLQPRARVWGTRLAALEVILLTISLGVMAALRLARVVVPTALFNLQMLASALSIGVWVWVFRALREPNMRARFSHEQNPDIGVHPGARLFATALLAAGFAFFVNITSWTFTGSVDVVREAFSHTVVVIEAADGKVWRTPLSDSGTFKFMFWRRPASPLRVAVCDTKSHAASNPPAFGYSYSDNRVDIFADRADAHQLCAAR